MHNNDCLTLSVPEAGRLLGVSRTLAYQMARSGQLPGVLRFGRAIRVSKPALLRWLGAAEDDDGLTVASPPARPERPDEV